MLSYAGLRDLALDSAIHPKIAWTFPLIVDGLTFVGSIGVIHAVLAGISSWYPWLLTLVGVAISVTGNVAAAPPEIVAQLVHGAPPLVLALSLEALLRVYRARAMRPGAPAHVGEAPAAAPAPTVLAEPAPAPHRPERPATTVSGPAAAPAPRPETTSRPDPAPPTVALEPQADRTRAAVVTAEQLRPSDALPRTKAPVVSEPEPAVPPTPMPDHGPAAQTTPAPPGTEPGAEHAETPATPRSPFATPVGKGSSPAAGRKVDPFAPAARTIAANAPRTSDTAAAATAVSATATAPTASTSGGSTRTRVRKMLLDDPQVTGADIARALGCDPSHARKLRREESAAIEAERQSVATELVGASQEGLFE